MITLPSRKQYRERAVSQPAKVAHHWVTTIIGICAAVVLLFSSLLQTTVLNENFMTDQITSSQVGQEVKNDINASFSSYGINGQLITTKQVNQLVKQAVHQVYAGKAIHLDTSEIMDGVQGRASNTLSSYGVPSTVINKLPTGALNDQVSSIINSRINTQEVTELENGIRLARVITITGLIIAVLMLLLIVVRTWLTRTVTRDFRWITLVSGIVSAGLLIMVKPVLNSYASDYASYSAVINQISSAILKVGWQMVLVDLGLALVLWVISLVFHRRRA